MTRSGSPLTLVIGTAVGLALTLLISGPEWVSVYAASFLAFYIFFMITAYILLVADYKKEARN